MGIARTEYMREQLGDELLDLMREIKRTFDPKNIFNPGKIFTDGRSRIDANLRVNFSMPIELPFEPRAGVRIQGPFVHRQSRAMQRLRRLPQRRADDVPDVFGDRR